MELNTINLKLEEKKLEFYDIKGNFLGTPINFLYSILFVLIFSIIIFFVYRFGHKFKRLKNNNLELLKKEKITIKSQKINFEKLIDEVKEKYLNEKKDVFYSKLADLYRIFLIEKYNVSLDKKTLKQIKSLIEENDYNLYEKIYFLEYNKEKDSENIRLEFLEEFKKNCF